MITSEGEVRDFSSMRSDVAGTGVQTETEIHDLSLCLRCAVGAYGTLTVEIGPLQNGEGVSLFGRRGAERARGNGSYMTATNGIRGQTC